MNENLVKKPKKDEEEIVEEEEDIELEDDEEESSSSDTKKTEDDPKKKMFLLMGIIVGGALILLLILYIASLFTTKTYNYEDMETILKDAAVAYFVDHPDQLPKNDGDAVVVDSSNLVYEGKMNDLSTYRNDGVACTGTVQVENVSGEYVYIPFLNCGESYSSVELASKIEEDNPTVSNGNGLYAINKARVFRGENVNNYVQLDKSLWRVVKINNDGTITLIHATGLDFYQPWDNRYNEERLYESGINNYSVSRIKDYLQKLYSNPSKDDGEEILSNNDKARLVSFTVCVGSRKTSSEGRNNAEECRQKVQNQKLGLLTLSDYLVASLDTTCKSADTKSCMNYNYLTTDDEWWLATPNAEDTSTVFKVDRSGVVKAEIASTYSRVRPVITLNSHTMFASGKGTADKPYKIK